MIQVNASSHPFSDHALELCRTAFKRPGHCCIAGNRGVAEALMQWLRSGAQTMRWKISHGDHHDPRQIDLVVALAFVIVIIAVCRFLSVGNDQPSSTALIVPSQSVLW